MPDNILNRRRRRYRTEAILALDDGGREHLNGTPTRLPPRRVEPGGHSPRADDDMLSLYEKVAAEVASLDNFHRVVSWVSLLCTVVDEGFRHMQMLPLHTGRGQQHTSHTESTQNVGAQHDAEYSFPEMAGSTFFSPQPHLTQCRLHRVSASFSKAVARCFAPASARSQCSPAIIYRISEMA